MTPPVGEVPAWNPAANLHVTQIRSVTGPKSPGLSHDSQGWEALVSVTRLRFLQLVCRHHLRQTPGLSSVLLGGHVPTPNPARMRKGSGFSGDRCLAMVGVQFGWEGSPTTFGSITTSYLVHGKKAIH